jgi:hypothetical protein
MTRELRGVPLRPAGGMCACRRVHSDRQQVSAGARASPSWIDGRRRPTRRTPTYTYYCVKLDDECALRILLPWQKVSMCAVMLVMKLRRKPDR